MFRPWMVVVADNDTRLQRCPGRGGPLMPLDRACLLCVLASTGLAGVTTTLPGVIRSRRLSGFDTGPS